MQSTFEKYEHKKCSVIPHIILAHRQYTRLTWICT